MAKIAKTNERVTENIVRIALTSNGDYENNCEQVHLPNGKIPEFVIYRNQYAFVVECKAQIKDHKKAIKEVKEYMIELAKEYKVVGVAVSGNHDVTSIDAFYCDKKSKKATTKLNCEGKFLSVDDFIGLTPEFKAQEKFKTANLHSLAAELHEDIRNYCDLRSAEKPVFVASVMIALLDTPFKLSYKNYTSQDLGKEVVNAVRRVLISDHVDNGKIESVMASIAFIAASPVLKNELYILNKKQSVLKFIIDFIEKYIVSRVKSDSIDVMGLFYNEFFSYTSGNDGSNLGIVLTPNHVCELMCDLIKVSKSDTLLDICTGTGGFLVTALNKMLNECKTKAEREHVKRNCLIGVEKDPYMFTLAFANMKFRGDGKSNLYNGSCFDKDIILSYQNRATKAILNPPYSMTRNAGTAHLHELNFTLQALNSIRPGGLCATIIPVSCFIEDSVKVKDFKSKLFEKHTLNAVITMPKDLFPGVGTHVAIAIFKSGTPHSKTKKVLFYDLENDGHITDRTLGRADGGNWKSIKQDVLTAYENNEVTDLSIIKTVTETDEWLYSCYKPSELITPDLFARQLLNYTFNNLNTSKNLDLYDTFNILKNIPQIKEVNITLNTWKKFKITNLFKVDNGRGYSSKEAINNIGINPFICSSKENNGMSCLTSLANTHKKGTLTLNKDGSVGECFYQPKDFSTNKHVYVLTPNFKMSENIALFMCTCISTIKDKYSFGRAISKTRLQKEFIKLPVDENGNPDYNWIEKYMESLTVKSKKED